MVTGRLDNLQRELAHDFGLSDIRSHNDTGKSVMQNIGRDGKLPDLSPHWVDLPGHMRPGWSGRKEKPEPVTVEGFSRDNAIKAVGTPILRTNVVGRVSASELPKASDV